MLNSKANTSLPSNLLSNAPKAYSFNFMSMILEILWRYSCTVLPFSVSTSIYFSMVFLKWSRTSSLCWSSVLEVVLGVFFLKIRADSVWVVEDSICCSICCSSSAPYLLLMSFLSLRRSCNFIELKVLLLLLSDWIVSSYFFRIST